MKALCQLILTSYWITKKFRHTGIAKLNSSLKSLNNILCQIC